MHEERVCEVVLVEGLVFWTINDTLFRVIKVYCMYGKGREGKIYMREREIYSKIEYIPYINQ